MKKWKKILYLCLAILLVYVAFNFSNVIYGIRQLKGQLHLIYNAVPAEEVLNDPSFPEDKKAKLRLIQDIRKFAVDSLGLKNSENYTTVYNQHDKPVLWVLTACPLFEMEPYEWKFPFLGAVSYKGFFIEELGKKEELLLKQALYDTDLSPAGGWSTLGWFKDPVLSNMLKRSEGRIAELIIHELLHATIFLPGSVEFNENLATFVGEQGAIRFLSNHYGAGSKELTEYIYYKSDEELYGNYMVDACHRLDSLYKSFSDESFREKLQMKYDLILDIISGTKKLSLHHPERYILEFPGSEIPNNTWFMSFKRYRSKQTQMEVDLAEQKGDLRSYVQSLLKK